MGPDLVSNRPGVGSAPHRPPAAPIPGAPMNIELDCPSCAGRLSFAARRTRGGGRLVGACDSCSSVFTLYGGRIAPLDVLDVRRPGPLAALVARQR